MSQKQDIETGFAAVGGAQLYYEATGEGHPLILIHAGIADCRMWDKQFSVFSVFAERYRVVRYDARIGGRSTAPDAPFSRWEDLRGVMDHLGIERAHLVGCSMGGGTAIDFTLENPDRVSALVTVGSAPSGYEYDGPPPTLWDDVVAAWKAGDIEKTCECEVRLWVDGPQRTPDQVDPAVRQLVYEMDLILLQNEKANPNREAQPLEPRAVGRLDAIQTPTLVMVGALDTESAQASADVLAAGIKNARKVVIPGAAHLPNMEHPDLFNRLVLDFLA